MEHLEIRLLYFPTGTIEKFNSNNNKNILNLGNLVLFANLDSSKGYNSIVTDQSQFIKAFINGKV